VLWIGYLQWHIRTRGNKAVAEPVVHDYGNIEHRDAVLAWEDTDLAYDANGRLLSRWDGKTLKTHPVTGALAPDEAALVPQWTYSRPRQAEWLQADFVVGNPPFIGAKYVREALGDGYAEALRKAWPEVPESARKCRLCHALVEPRGCLAYLRLSPQDGPDYHQQPAPDL
jgi:hypothetical protein